jgi:hypothetical protein
LSPEQNVEHLRRTLGVAGLHLDQAARLRVHRRQVHHIRVVFAQAFRALDRVLLALELLEELAPSRARYRRKYVLSFEVIS